MSDPIPFDEHAERLKIRTAPRPVARLNRKVLMAGAGLGALALLAATSIALQPPRATDPDTSPALYNTANTSKPEGLSRLPAGYGDLPQGAGSGAGAGAPRLDTPRLGPPLAGDLGATMLRAERELGLEPERITSLEDDFRPSPAEEAERARRMREAALAEEAAGAPVFFTLDTQTSQAAAGTASGPRIAEPAPARMPDRELLALAGLSAQAPGLAAPPGLGAQSGLRVPAEPNLQARKLAFAGEAPGTDIYNPHGVEDPVSPYQIMAGTLIAASLVTGINSDLPGTVIAQVTQPVYDTVTGRHLLIPQGARLIGRYQSEISFGQDRALVSWERIIFPDGSSIVITAPGADAQGQAGLADRTDHHWDRVFQAAGLATLLGIGTELGSEDEDAVTRAIRRGTGDTVDQAGQRAVERNLDIQPTIRVRPGWPVRVVVTRDLVLRPHDQGGEQ
ncbi:TrbI/VirB10 family protein [Parvularcula flava]|uniref:Conjugal transfer protein TrbI n=1 Tax=Aquisalinus luteolus TaxID=1566827 RepID=A0A8J3A0V1_9PROT|nr:TrbI/VirB10 family protein [Aquisalinus luteolus]NHK27112.1 TrbI/VirB10 family protein [Aquisalinus luteolus]GGH94410.1 conjugal transfer protein TrbI [Aquisalinus luteolus]